MHMTATMKGDTVVVSVAEPRIDAAAAIRFKDRMREVVPPSAARVLLDLAQVEFIDSSGLGAIVAVRKQLRADQAFGLAAMQPNVDRVFRLTRMDSVFPIHADVVEGLRDHAG